MNISEDHLITREQAEHFEIVEKLAEQAFGPGRFTRTAFRLREGVPHEEALSFVCWKGDAIIASVRLTKLWIGEDEALLLGPLVVSPAFKAKGYGAKLMAKAVEAARLAGHSAILLVGDLPYYQKFGFEQVSPGSITLPGPVDPARLLLCDLHGIGSEAFKGQARPYSAIT